MKAYLLFALLALTACQSPARPDNSGDQEVIDNPQKTEYTLEENIGMMLLVGFRGTEVDSTKNPEIITALRDYHVGSVILFDVDGATSTRGRNIQSAEQLVRLSHQLRELNPNVLIGIDQEGGYVSRLSSRYGFPRIPSAKRLAAMGDDSLRYYADVTGEMLETLGINLNFAPVADVDVNPACPVIGAIERSFSADAGEVRHSCMLWYDEMKKHGVISCMKHFPGHGSAKGDTHKGLVDVTDTWKRYELEPYNDLPGEHMMVMTAHVVNRRLDPTGLPASLSPKITSYLRDTLGFQGVIVTDDMAMGAIVKQYSFNQAIRMAVLAGADLLCLSNNGGTYDTTMVQRTVSVIKKMVEDGTIDEERIAQSAQRVRKVASFSR